MLELVIGNKNLSSWSLRPWIMLRHASIPFVEEMRRFEEAGWRDAIGSVSPSGRVPVLRDGKLVVWDSLAICEYVAETNSGAKLWPDDPGARAVARSVSAEMHSGFSHLRRDLSMDVVARFPRRSRAQETEREIQRVLAIWDDCRFRFGGSGSFLFGRFSIADAMFAPVVWRFRSYDVPVSGRAAEYQAMMLELPAMKSWEADAEAEVRAQAARAHLKTNDPRSAQHAFAVIFSSKLRRPSEDYSTTAAAMVELAHQQPGFLGVESARGADGFGITVSYWDSLEAISAFNAIPIHREAQGRGRSEFYERYELRVCTVERGYGFQEK
jgi:glutathione S-transferase